MPRQSLAIWKIKQCSWSSKNSLRSWNFPTYFLRITRTTSSLLALSIQKMKPPWWKLIYRYLIDTPRSFICKSLLFSRFWIIFTIIIQNSLSGTFPVSSSFVWFGGHLFCSFTCWVFLCLFLLFILLCLGWPFCILAVCGVLFIVEFPWCGWGSIGVLSRFPG